MSEKSGREIEMERPQINWGKLTGRPKRDKARLMRQAGHTPDEIATVLGLGRALANYWSAGGQMSRGEFYQHLKDHPGCKVPKHTPVALTCFRCGDPVPERSRVLRLGAGTVGVVCGLCMTPAERARVRQP